MEFTLEDEMRFWEKVDIQGEDECWNWLAGTRAGYGIFRLKNKIQLANRVALWTVNGPPPHEKPNSLHSCNNRKCCNPSHLRWGSQAENMRDLALSGTHNGINNIQSKLTEQQVREIREKYKTQLYTQRTLANMYGISQSNIFNIIKNISYK